MDNKDIKYAIDMSNYDLTDILGDSYFVALFVEHPYIKEEEDGAFLDYRHFGRKEYLVHDLYREGYREIHKDIFYSDSKERVKFAIILEKKY